MANLTETSAWEAGIYQLEEEDLVQGGADGIDNVQGKQLANRTLYLKGLVEGLGLNKQDADATLTAIAALTGSADKLVYFNGIDTAALTTFTAFARTLVAAADAAAARTAIGAVTQADINNAIAALVNSSPAALDTLNEFASALGNDPNFATTIMNALATKGTQSGIQAQTYTAFTTAGAAPNFTLTPSPVITAYTAGQRFRVKFNMAGNGSDVINVSALGNKALKQYDSAGSKVAAVIAASQLTDVEYDGVDMVLLDPLIKSVTAISNPTFADSSVNPASTNWVRGAMSAIATAAGFAISLAANGHIKFPSWLGGLVVQWGSLANSATASLGTTVTFPIAFPTACRAVLISNSFSSSQAISFVASSTNAANFTSTCSVASGSATWLAIGN